MKKGAKKKSNVKKSTAKTKAHISKKSKSQKAKKSPSKKSVSVTRKTSKPSAKRKQVKYDNFLVTFTAIRSYEYNRPTELEVFTRSIPVYPAETLAGFKEKYLQWIIEEEMNTFKKITEDTDGKVYWHSWIYEVKAGEEEF